MNMTHEEIYLMLFFGFVCWEGQILKQLRILYFLAWLLTLPVTLLLSASSYIVDMIHIKQIKVMFLEIALNNMGNLNISLDIDRNGTNIRE